MAKEMRLTIDDNTNKAINKMKAKHLMNGVELTRPSALIEIVKEWSNQQIKVKAVPEGFAERVSRCKSFETMPIPNEIKSSKHTIEGKAKDNYLEAINKFEANK